MSWQRIDENTYIDDTLVTCAEYQLFIDEMHEQGKYYPPDHWAWYKFPNGFGKSPILGVRSTDAMLFCEWLSRQSIEKWKFRLPAKFEATDYPILAVSDSLTLGHWVGATNGQAIFFWIGATPINARAINPTAIHDRARVRVEPTEEERSLISDRFKFTDMVHNLPRPISADIDRAIDKAIDRALNRALNIDTEVKLHVNHIRDGRVRPRSNFENSEFDLDLDHVLDHILQLYNTYYGEDEVKKISLDLLVDLFTLQERFWGRSPAFEGIRLVKERIR